MIICMILALCMLFALCACGGGKTEPKDDGKKEEYTDTYNIVYATTDAQGSIFDEMLITPSSMDYFDIRIEDIVKVNIHTLEYGNQRIPSTEVRMHAAAYRAYPDCKAMIQTRSNAISVFAACRAGFALGEGELQELIGDVKVTAYAPPGTEELAEAVVSTLSETHACVIPHHGAVFYGPSLDVVLAIAEAVEMKARNLLSFDSGF